MKKTILITLAVFAFSFLNAQVPYQTYSQGDIIIQVEPGKSQGTMYMDIGEVGIITTSKDRSKFLTFIQESYDKYSEWAKVAKENNVQKLRKDIKTVSFRGYFKYGNKWKFSTAKLRSIFTVEDGEPAGFVYIGAMVASDNEFMKSKGEAFYLNPEIVSEFNSYLNEEKITKFITSKNSVDDLFKN